MYAGGDPVTALVQQTGNGTSTDKGRKETVFRKSFLKGAYQQLKRLSEDMMSQTGDTCHLVPGLLFLLSRGIESLR